jgi:hypothetical protein
MDAFGWQIARELGGARSLRKNTLFEQKKQEILRRLNDIYFTLENKISRIIRYFRIAFRMNVFPNYIKKCTLFPAFF